MQNSIPGTKIAFSKQSSREGYFHKKRNEKEDQLSILKEGLPYFGSAKDFRITLCSR
jgi:hypothetical protein